MPDFGLPHDLSVTPDHALRSVFKQAVADTGLSNNELARRSGYSRSAIGYILNGRREGKLSTWSDVLDAAGIEIGYRIKEEVQHGSP